MTPHEANTRLAADIKLLTRDAEELLKATAGEASEKVAGVRKRLTAAIESAKASCQHMEEKTVETAKATDQAIRTHPYQSIGIAFGVGLLIGVLSGRR